MFMSERNYDGGRERMTVLASHLFTRDALGDTNFAKPNFGNRGLITL
jgi:hypothetical protein